MKSWSWFLAKEPVIPKIPQCPTNILADFNSIQLNVNFDDFSLELEQEMDNVILPQYDSPEPTQSKVIELSPFESVMSGEKPSMFSRIKRHISIKLKNQKSGFLNIPADSSIFAQFSPVNLKLPLNDNERTKQNRMLSNNLFSGISTSVDDIIEQTNLEIERSNLQIFKDNIEIKSISMKNLKDLYYTEKPSKIKFNAFNDVLVYQKDDYQVNSTSGSLKSQDSDYSLRLDLFPKLRQSLKSTQSNRILSRNHSKQGEFSKTLPLRANKKLTNVLTPTHSILKNKLNSNFEAEIEGTKKLDSVNINHFMKEFHRTEIEKADNEPYLRPMRLQQMASYHHQLV